jgi:ParB family transcriptional regulator, chromosome partitioning protein
MTFANARQNWPTGIPKGSGKRFVPKRSKTTRLFNKAAVAKVVFNPLATPDSTAPAVSLPGRPPRSPRLLPTIERDEVFMSDPNVTIKNLSEGRADIFRVDPNKLVIVIEPSHPLFDERVSLPVDDALVASIMEHGIRQAVTVRRNGSLFEVMDGRQRVKAAIQANKSLPKSERILVPVTMAKDNDVQAAKIMVALNEIRTQDSPMVQASKAKRLLDRGIPKQEVANQFGKPTSWLAQLMKVLDTDDTVQHAVDKGMIAVTAASKLAALPRDEQKKAMAELRDSGRALTRTNVKAKVKAVRTAAETGQAQQAIITPPKRSVIVAVHDAYEDAAGSLLVGIPPASLLKWVLTGMGASEVNGPGERGTLADWLREYETTSRVAPKPSGKEAATA